MENNRVKESFALPMMKALLASYILTGLALLLLAFLLFKFELGESQVNLGILLIYILSCFVGGRVLGKKMGSRRYLWGMVLGIGYAVLLMAVSYFTEGQSSLNMKDTGILLFLCFSGGTLGGMLS